MEKKYTLKEIQKLIEKAEKYEALEKKGRLLMLPCQLDSTIYRVVKMGGQWRVMQGVFTADFINDYGVTVFGTEPEAVIAATTRNKINNSNVL